MVEIQQIVAVAFALAVVLVFAMMLYVPAVARGSRGGQRADPSSIDARTTVT